MLFSGVLLAEPANKKNAVPFLGNSVFLSGIQSVPPLNAGKPESNGDCVRIRLPFLRKIFNYFLIFCG